MKMILETILKDWKLMALVIAILVLLPYAIYDEFFKEES